LVVGLTVSGVIPEEDGWDPFTLTPDPLPKPPPPNPQPQQQTEQTFVTVPPTPLPPLVADPADFVTRDPIVEPTRFVVDPGPAITPTVEPSVTPGFAPKRARPANDPLRWITTDDYPARALRAEAEGIASYRLIVATSGRVSACELTRSTGNGQLDQATCDFIARRARFEPATDETGAKVVGAYTGTVKWDIPE
jgi:protein TonB